MFLVSIIKKNKKKAKVLKKIFLKNWNLCVNSRVLPQKLVFLKIFYHEPHERGRTKSL